MSKLKSLQDESLASKHGVALLKKNYMNENETILYKITSVVHTTHLHEQWNSL